LLRKHGYRTGFVGKWGVGNELPRDEYDYFDGFAGPGRYYEKDSDYETQTHLTRRQGASALKFLESCSPDQPFCLQVSFKAPHCQDGDAWQFPSDHALRDLYTSVEIPLAPTATDEHYQALPPMLRDSEARVRWGRRFADPDMYQRTVKDYYRLITGIDREVGNMIALLREKGLEENTVVIYTSDNGFYLGEFGLAGKWFTHEPSIRVPLIIRDGRGGAGSGRVESRIALNIDIAPTILELAGIPIPPAMQGRSLVPLLRDQPVPWRTDFFYEHLFEHAGIPKSEAVRGPRWKYSVYESSAGRYEQLVDLEADPHETQNLAG